MVILAILTR